jgi:hypothetical protein
VNNLHGKKGWLGEDPVRRVLAMEVGLFARYLAKGEVLQENFNPCQQHDIPSILAKKKQNPTILMKCSGGFSLQ